MRNQTLAEAAAELRETARKIGSSDDGHSKEANAARESGLKLDSYWAGAIDASHVAEALFLNALNDISPEPEEECCSECGQVRKQE